MNCGTCLFSRVEVVALGDDNICPVCGADYSRPATEEEITTTIAEVKPIIFTVGKEITRSAPKKDPYIGGKTTLTPKVLKSDEPKEPMTVAMTDNEVIEYLQSHGHTSRETALGALAATPIFGKGVASRMAKEGKLSVAGQKRGSVYWVAEEPKEVP